MRLFGSATPSGGCHFCEGKAISGENAAHGRECRTLIHLGCLKRNGLLAEEDHRIRSDEIKANCPTRGSVGTLANA